MPSLEDIEEYYILQSIPGIGEKIAATIISEIGEIDRFNSAKKARCIRWCGSKCETLLVSLQHR